MAYRTRSARRYVRKSKRNFIATLIICALLLYATLFWILPNFINGLGFVNNIFKTPTKNEVVTEATLAPPVLNIPYEATNTAEINIKGFATAHSKVKIFVDDALRQEVEPSENGSFVVENIKLSIGTNNIYGQTVDEKNQESLPSKTIRLIYDNEKPPLIISEPEEGEIVEGERKVRVEGITEAGVSVFINGNQIIIGSDGNFSVDQSINEGENILTIKVLDKAANFTEIIRGVTAK